MKLAATLTDGTATTLTSGNTLKNGHMAGGGGLLTDVSLLSSADTSIAVSISDDVGVVFNVASADFTTRTNYKNDNAAILRNQITGALVVTATGIDSGNIAVSAFVKPNDRAT